MRSTPLEKRSMLKVISPGFQTTVQDAGRFHFAHLGVSQSGAADPVAFRLGNRLVENQENTPSLEMTLLGGTFEFEEDRLIALTGADCGPTLGQQSIPMWTTILIRAGQRLECRAMQEGARTYLSIQGGISVQKVMESAATHLQTGLGGWHGRAIQKGERLPLGRSFHPSAFRVQSVPNELQRYLQERRKIHITPAPQTDLFPDSSLKVLTTASYVVSESSNRVGLRLTGKPIDREKKEELITEGISLGAIQVPPNGMILVAIGAVIEACSFGRYRLLDCTTLVERGLTFLLLTLFVTAPSLLILLAAQQASFGQVAGFAQHPHRLALLSDIRAATLNVADFSKIAG